MVIIIVFMYLINILCIIYICPEKTIHLAGFVVAAPQLKLKRFCLYLAVAVVRKHNESPRHGSLALLIKIEL